MCRCDVRSFLANLVAYRVVLIATGQFGDVTVEGGGEKEGLTVG